MNRKGFTLIELVVAVAILGVLMVIAIPSVRYIQENREAKYLAYDKAIKSAGKVYNDAYNEDLFGIDNTGCAVITYANLHEKDLIDDIQIRNNSCGLEDTFVFVKKNNRGNYHYDSYVTCRQNNKIVYGNGKKPNDIAVCDLEDNAGSPPEIEVYDVSDYKDKTILKRTEKRDLRVKLSDTGVGLKKDQKVDYQWYQNNTRIGGQNTIDFDNENYDSEIIRKIPLPSEMNDIRNSDTFKVEITGTVMDINNNSRDVNVSYEIKYYVGKVFIKFNVNGGNLTSPYDSKYSVQSNLLVDTSKTENKDIIHTILEDESLTSDGLINYNNTSAVNLKRTNYKIDANNEWNTSADGTGKTYNQKDAYKATDFCPNVASQDCYVTLYANWKKAVKTVTISFNPNGASGSVVTRSCDYYIDTQTGCSVASPGISRSGYTAVGWNTSSSATSSGWNAGASKTVSSDTTYYAITYKTIKANFSFNISTYRNINNLTGGSRDSSASCNAYNNNTSCNVTTPVCNFGKGANTYARPIASYFDCKWGSVVAGNAMSISGPTTVKLTVTAKSKYVGSPGTTKLYLLCQPGAKNVIIRSNDEATMYTYGIDKKTNQGHSADNKGFYWDGKWVVDKDEGHMWFHGKTAGKETKCTQVKDSQLCKSGKTTSAQMTGHVSARMVYYK